MVFAAVILLAATPAGGEDVTARTGFMDQTPLHGVEAVVDRGPVSEVIVRCSSGRATVSFSKADKVFCAPKAGCARDLSPIAARACGE